MQADPPRHVGLSWTNTAWSWPDLLYGDTAGIVLAERLDLVPVTIHAM